MQQKCSTQNHLEKITGQIVWRISNDQPVSSLELNGKNASLVDGFHRDAQILAGLKLENPVIEPRGRYPSSCRKNLISNNPPSSA